MDKQKTHQRDDRSSQPNGPSRPVGKRACRRSLLLAFLCGVLGGLGAAFGTEFYLDRSFTTGEEMERRIGLVHLASIPEEL